MFLTAKFLKLNVIFYLIQQLLFVPHLCVYAFLDFETKEFINGKVFRAAILHYPPAIAIKKEANGTYSYDGASIEILRYFARANNVTLEFVHLNLADVAKHSIGIAQRNIILNDEADMSALGFAPSLNYSQIDLSVPVMIQPYRLIVPWPDEESRLLAPIRPFQPVVWLCLGATLAVVAPTLAFISGMYEKLTKETGSSPASIIQVEDVAQTTLFLLSHLTNHGYHVRLNSRARTILIVIWLLMTIVLANGYAGVLFSFLSVPKLEPIVNSLDELAESKTVQLVTLEKTTWALQLMDAENGTQKLIADSLRKNPDNLIIIEDAEEKLMSGKFAFAYYDMYNFGIIDSVYKKNGNKCRLTPARESISFYSPVSFGLAKFGPYTTTFNRNVQALLEAGLIDRFIKIRVPHIDQCLIKNHDVSAKQKRLTLVDMSSAFVILGFGLSLALLVFCWELVYKCFFKNHYLRN